MLGRSERESPAHARLAARLAGWSGLTDGGPWEDDGADLLELGTTSATLATVASIDDLAAVVHLGHPAQPSHDLERALLAADPSLRLTAAVAVPAQWVWVAPRADVTGGVVVDEAGMRDCRHALRTMGASPRLVPTSTPVDERAALAGRDGSLVVERDRVPAGWVELPGSVRLSEGAPVWYGLLESRAAADGGSPPLPEGPAQVWLAFGPRDEHRGSLQQTLSVVAAAGIDLQHLRSHRSTGGTHLFFSSFSCPDAAVLDGLRAEFVARGVAHRVLAVLPGSDFLPGPDALDPRWSA